MKATLTLAGQTFPVNPTGLANLITDCNRNGTDRFYRQKPGGNIAFIGDDFAKVRELAGCCAMGILAVYDCEILTGAYQVRSEKIAWDFGLETASLSGLTVSDDYTGVYQLWEKKVNMLKLAADVTIQQDYQFEIPKDYSGDATDTTPKYGIGSIANDRYRSFGAFARYLVQQTFTGTAYEYLVPSTVSALSVFLTRPINPADGRANLFLRAAFGQASDVCEPLSSNSATGVLLAGEDNEAMAMSLKDFMEAMYSVFDVSWHVDPSTHKFTIEHRLFYDNGYSYDAPVRGIDTRGSRYADDVKNYAGNYKTKSEELFGVEEVILSGNQTLNNSALSLDPSNRIDKDERFFAKINDFEYGNVLYDYTCAARDEKEVLTRQTRTSDLFYTMLDSIKFNDSSIDKSKWFLVEYTSGTYTIPVGTIVTVPPRGGVGYVPPTTTPTTTVTTKSVFVFAKGTVERTGKTGILNANFSATSIMRSFHRHGRSFSSGLMNYNEKAALKGGVIRGMYSVRAAKILDLITITLLPFETVNPTELVVLPDGSDAQIDSYKIDRSREKLELNLVAQSGCGGPIVPVPVINQSASVPAKGTVLRTETFTVTCSDVRNGKTTEQTGSRTFFADGFGGEYSTQTDPCLSSGTVPTRGPR